MNSGCYFHYFPLTSHLKFTVLQSEDCNSGGFEMQLSHTSFLPMRGEEGVEEDDEGLGGIRGGASASSAAAPSLGGMSRGSGGGAFFWGSGG